MKRLLVLCLAVFPALATAQDWDVSYNYIGVGYGQLEQETLGVTVDLDGYSLEASGGGEHIHAFASYTRGGEDNLLGFGVDLDLEQSTAGIGAHFNIQPGSLLIQPAVSVYVDLAYTRMTAAAGVLAAVDDGLVLGTGIRVMPGARSEFHAGISRYQGDIRMWHSSGSTILAGESDATALGLGGSFYVTDSAALHLSYSTSSDTDTDVISLGMLFYLGRGVGD